MKPTHPPLSVAFAATFVGVVALALPTAFAGPDEPATKPAKSTKLASDIPSTVEIDAISAPTQGDALYIAELNFNLPAGTLLKRATLKQTCNALALAVHQHREDAVDLLRLAVLARTPKQNDGRLPCPDLRQLIEAAANAAPDKVSQLIDMAESLDPDCADDLQTALGTMNASGAGGNGPGGVGQPDGPGFTGSPPEGVIALPTPNPQVTIVVNG